MGWTEFYEQAVHGIVDLRMGRAAELDEKVVRRRARTDGSTLLYPGVWRLPAHPDTPRSRAAAALRAVGPEALADRHTALALHDLCPFPTVHQVLLPHGSRIRRVPSVEVRRGLLDVDDLGVVLARHPHALGRRRVRQVIHDLDRDGSDSGLEYTTRDRVVAAGFLPDREQPTVLVAGGRRRIDIAWLALRVGIECQGYLHHAGRDGLDRDAVRLNSLVAEGDWVVLQVTATMLHDGWEQFLGDLRACLRRRADLLGLPHPAGSAAA